MKLPAALVEHISGQVVQGLLKEGLLEAENPMAAVGALRAAVIDDLMVEDRLNDEVREILRSHSDEMDRRGVQYHDMFRMIKSELVRKRKLVL